MLPSRVSGRCLGAFLKDDVAVLIRLRPTEALAYADAQLTAKLAARST